MASLQEVSETPEEMGQERDEDTEQHILPAHNSPSSLDEAAMLLPPTAVDDFKQFQELFRQVAQSQNIPFKEVTENQHRLLEILHTASMSKIALPYQRCVDGTGRHSLANTSNYSPMCKRID